MSGSTEPPESDDFEESQNQSWREIISHSSLYALILGSMMMIEATLDTESLNNVPHPLTYFVPLLVIIIVLSVISSSLGVDDTISSSVESPMKLYVIISFVVGCVWILL